MSFTLYLSGPMSGIENNNYPAFHRACKELREAGYTVVNPAELPEGWTYARYMQQAMNDLPACHGVAVLDGAWQSKGARQELKLALLLEKPISNVKDWIVAPTWLQSQNVPLSCGERKTP